MRRVFAILLVVPALVAQTGRIRRQTMRPVIRGTDYAVSTRKPQAAQVAERILRAGGNAFDAAVACQAALGVTDAASNGVGSDAEILIYDAKAKRVYSINAEGTAPKLATIDWYKEHEGGKIPVNDGLLAGTVPGVVDAWYTLLDRWGTMTFAEVLAPAIELAGKGFPLSEGLAGAIRSTEKLRKYPTSRAVYLPNGEAPRVGEVFRNTELASTLQMLVDAEHQARRKGRRAALKAARDRFYKGDIARKMADFSEANGGLFRYEDFASYKAEVEDPVSTDYHGYDVYKNPSATQGPAELFTLEILRGFDLKAMGHNSADYIHVNVEAVKLAFADREMYLGDADFIKIPFAGLLSEPYAAERRSLIDMAHASYQFRPGEPWKYMENFPPINRPSPVTLEGDADHEGDTSYLAVVDHDRNAVSWTPSLHSGFGTGVVMADLGFPFNCRGDYFWLKPESANALQPGKRPRSTLTPTMILKDGKPYMVVGSPGGDDQCMRIFQTFLNVVDFGMNIQQAIEAPRWTTTSFPASPFPHTMHPGEVALEDRISQEVRVELERRGHKVSLRGPWTMGATSAIVIDPQTGVLSAGADPRGDNYALAW
ncbi:MAG TPA: gamma-glutamyltransferase [Bryobacterales bacterium]|nr:gamma-glutamyltransferase [Bryobacterales bacterium]